MALPSEADAVTIRERFTRTISVLSADTAGVDEYGNPVVTETSVDVLGHYRQLSADELGENVSESAWRVYLPAETSVAAGDRLILGALTVEVVGLAQELYDVGTGLVVGKALRAEVAA